MLRFLPFIPLLTWLLLSTSAYAACRSRTVGSGIYSYEDCDNGSQAVRRHYGSSYEDQEYVYPTGRAFIPRYPEATDEDDE